MHGRTKAMLT